MFSIILSSPWWITARQNTKPILCSSLGEVHVTKNKALACNRLITIAGSGNTASVTVDYVLKLLAINLLSLKLLAINLLSLKLLA